jgi:hypothetical protein
VKRGRPRKDGLLLATPQLLADIIKRLPRPSKRLQADLTRDMNFVARYRSGETLAEIGSVYGITRERVRQRLAKHGIKASSGGARIRSVLRSKDRHEARQTRLGEYSLRKFGVPHAVFCEITGLSSVQGCDYIRKNNGNPIVKAYLNQKYKAMSRGIGWEISLADWWRIWQESGKWDRRGRGQGYCMARWGDSGPYRPDNVYICTVGQNFSDSYIVKPASARAAKRRANLEAAQ